MSSSPPALPVERLTTLANLVVVVEARRRNALLAWFLDSLVLWVVAAATFVGAAASTDAVSAALLALTAVPVGAFCYGLTTAHRRSLGQLAAGTRTVRHADGTVPGFWRGGWVMLLRTVLLPIFFAFYLWSELMLDDAVDDGKVRHVSIDDRATQALWRSQPRLAQPWLEPVPESPGGRGDRPGPADLD